MAVGLLKMKTPLINYHTSPAGLRMVHLHVKGGTVGYCGVAVKVGSRDESAQGLAHFVEHTIFKGTGKRSSWHIINRMEAVGGELNAYTTKEETVVYSAFPSGNLSRAAELIADLVCNSQFPERELEKEREVVADEIDSYLDTPSEAVFDDFEDLLFAGNSIGHNILGSRTALDTFTSDMCRDYLHRWYVPGNMVVFYAGAQSPDRVFAQLEKAFAPLSGAVPVRMEGIPPVIRPFAMHKEIDSHQCHTVVGARTGGFDAPERYSLALLTNILGGPGMNSLLNVALRERRGLVYSVEASTGIFSDCGEFVVYYGCDPDDNERCRKLVESTIASVADGYMTSRRLEAAKKQYLGQLIIASENMENRILGIAHQLLFRGYVIPSSEVAEAIKAVTPEEIATLASTFTSPSYLTLGPK